VSSPRPSLTERLDRLQRLQDLDIHLREAQDPNFRKAEEEMGFVLSEEGLRKLQQIRNRRAAEMMANAVMKADLRLYEHIRQRYERAVERVEDGICLGCYATQPMAARILAYQKQVLPRCENCGRILYWTLDQEGE
jgi:predicted  nucleic acid-binding Zn-ribbon protein